MLNNIFKKEDNNGAIILIAVMIMATLLTAALGTGTLVINIINQSASIDYSIAAYYAAETGIEKNLYSIRQDGYIPLVKTYGTPAPITESLILDDNVTLKANYDLAAINGKDTIVFDLAANQEYSVDIYDPSINAQSFVDAVQLQLNGYGNASAPVTIQMTAVSWSQGQIEVPSAEIRSIQQGTGPIDPPITLNLADAHVHKVKLKAFGGDLSNLVLTAYNSQTCPSGNCSTSMPGTYVLTSTGSYPNNNSRQATQVLTVEMPILEPAYGLYNFVIFSEGDITKSVNW
ncbi:MAG: hypothetical protein ACKKL6_03335 [Candidatus Komeilibacteria bacterium]